MNDWREREALHRYGVVRELCDERLTGAQRGVLVRAAAGRLHAHPSGELRTHGRATIDRWIRAWRAGGFEALKPRVRVTGPLIDPVLLGCAADLRLEAPERTGAQIAEILRVLHGPDAPSARTVQRHLARAGLARSDVRGGGEVHGLGRFEATAPNELWVADALHGPIVALERGGAARRKAICFAIEDDHSRLIVAARFEASETELRLERTLRAALEARGVPDRLYVDNGPVRVGGARPDLRVPWDPPRAFHARPQGRGKIERFCVTTNVARRIDVEDRTELVRCCAGDGGAGPHRAGGPPRPPCRGRPQTAPRCAGQEPGC